MARTAITPQAPTSAGLALVAEAANADGHSIPSEGAVLKVINGSGGSINVTLVTPGSADASLAIPDRVVAVPAGETRYFGDLDAVYRQPDGTVHVNLSAVVSVTVAALQV